LTHFVHPEKIDAVRLVLNPQISYSYLQSGFFVTPKLSLNARKYELDGTAAQIGTLNTSVTRTLPTFSVDSGLVFERDSNLFGDGMTQTLEPRLFYVNTPFRDQSQIPIFDTSETSFNFTQLFSENRFVGQDRISDSNQVTFGLISRFIEESGLERLRLAFGQRYNFREQRVLLDSNTPIQSGARSDVLLAASGRISQTISIDTALQYNVSTNATVSSNLGMQWKPAEKSVLNAEYRYLRNSFEQVNLSGQWPLTQRLYGVGRITYSVNERRNTENLAGLEYNADCWVLRMVAQRFATTTQGATTSLFLQLELNGLSKLGNNPLEILSKNIPGYQKVNQP
jgi:LPS-assembly protein